MSSDNAIVTPHDHDVLSGRGNFVNYHVGNEHFRALVRKHKVAYVACPKPQKGKFSRMIVDEIRSRNPPGRFLKQDPVTKLWYDIGEKKALDKTRQALREGAPEIMKEIGTDEEGGDEQETEKVHQNSSRDGLPISNQQMMPSMQQPPPEMHPSNLNQNYPGQYIPQPVANPFDDPVDSMAPPVSMAPMRQAPVAVSSNPAPGRIMRHGFTTASPGVVPVRSLAGIRQHMQQQAQRNNALLQQQYHNQQGGMNGMNGGYGDVQNRGYMQQQGMMDQFEPRPIVPSSNGGVCYGNNYADPESHEHVGPLPGPLPQRFARERERQNMQREASDRSINMDKVFTLGQSSNHSLNLDKVFGLGQSSSHSKQFDNSAMSLSIGDIVSKITGEDGKNSSTDTSSGDHLAPLFDSSLRLGEKEEKREKRGGRKPVNPSNSSDGQDLAKVMDMSVMSIGGELSEIGDGSIMRMGTGSSANMSFTDVFDEADRDA
mmetsp:Transcript_19744/g.37430  ORF Transcript_19744/g.37430 Transcript_19744/m.37430 type:complete len:486 (-) Transcript_19744:237-1694(-)